MIIMPKKMTGEQLNEFAIEIFDILSNIPVDYIVKILELAIQKRNAIEDDESSEDD